MAVLRDTYTLYTHAPRAFQVRGTWASAHRWSKELIVAIWYLNSPVICSAPSYVKRAISTVVYSPPRIRASPMRTVRSPMESTASPHRLSTVHGLCTKSVRSPSRNPLSTYLRGLHGLCCLIECTKIEHNQDWTRDLQIIMWHCQHN